MWRVTYESAASLYVFLQKDRMVMEGSLGKAWVSKIQTISETFLWMIVLLLVDEVFLEDIIYVSVF